MVTSTWLPWTTFRYLALIAVIALGILSILGCIGPIDEFQDCDGCVSLSVAAVSPNEIALSWSSVDALSDDGYAVFMNGTTLLFRTDETSVVVSGLVPDTEYCFHIVAPLVFTNVYTSNVACATTLPTP